MAPDEPTWDDTGFESGSNDHSGFMPSDNSGRKRVTAPEPPSVPPPPARREQSRRGPLFWFSVLAGVVLVLAVVGGFFYWLSQPSVEEQAFLAPETAAPAPVAAPEAPLDTATEVEVTSSDVVHEPEALDLLYGKDTATAATPTERKAASSAAPAPEPSQAPSPAVSQRRVLPSEPPMEKTTSVKPPPATVPATPIAKDPASPVKTSKPVKNQTTTAPKGTAALYVVQVFSSPSRADADEWLQLLQSKNVTDAYVTEQKIKDQTWYRVRFGSYANREQAEADAIRLGFKEPWIARVR